jgi:hypothetical protein
MECHQSKKEKAVEVIAPVISVCLHAESESEYTVQFSTATDRLGQNDRILLGHDFFHMAR